MESSDGSLGVAVDLVKREVGGFGFIIKKQATSRRVLIGDIVKGSVAEETGLLQVGDVLLEVNGSSLENASIDETRELLASIPTGSKAKLKVLVKENDRRLVNWEKSANGNSQTTPVSLSTPDMQPKAQAEDGAIPNSNAGNGVVARGNHVIRTQEVDKCDHFKLPPQNPKYVKLKNLIDGKYQTDTLHQKANVTVGLAQQGLSHLKLLRLYQSL